MAEYADEHIRVHVRVRPLNEQERQRGCGAGACSENFRGVISANGAAGARSERIATGASSLLDDGVASCT